MEESNYWTRLNRKRIGRRALLSAGATTALGAAAAAVVGCGGGGNGNGGSSRDKRPRGNSAPPSYRPPLPRGTLLPGRLLQRPGHYSHIRLTRPRIQHP